jgi:pyrroline-5-carboxylate reductase
MPNMPIAVHKGATPLIANQFVSREQQEIVTQLFQSRGLMIWVSNEDDINIFTALSGSGPAYIFLFLEAMIHAAQQLGLQEDLAQAFALQTVSGAVELAKASALTMDELRKKVTSPGGTTAAAIQVFKEQKFEEIVSQAMHAAFMRSKGVVNEID